MTSVGLGFDSTPERPTPAKPASAADKDSPHERKRTDPCDLVGARSLLVARLEVVDLDFG
jgi:hypothetical protein